MGQCLPRTCVVGLWVVVEVVWGWWIWYSVGGNGNGFRYVVGGEEGKVTVDGTIEIFWSFGWRSALCLVTSAFGEGSQFGCRRGKVFGRGGRCR